LEISSGTKTHSIVQPKGPSSGDSSVKPVPLVVAFINAVTFMTPL
jgi:hypothetical protein